MTLTTVLTVALKSVPPNQKCIFLTSCIVLLPYFSSFSVSCFDTSCKVFYLYFSIIYQNGTLLVVIRTPKVHVKYNTKEKETPIIIHSHDPCSWCIINPNVVLLCLNVNTIDVNYIDVLISQLSCISSIKMVALYSLHVPNTSI